MATINVRSRADASNAYRVVWREGGRRAGPQQSETFSDRAEAERFKAAVELAGHLWPAGWTPGLGFGQPPEPAGDEPARAGRQSLLEFGLAHVRDLTNIGPDTRNRYSRQLRTLERELTALFGRVPTVGGLTETEVRRWVNWRGEQPTGGSPKTVSNYHGLLFAVYATAVRLGVRPDNPCAGHRLPDRRDSDGDGAEISFLVESQFALLADCMLPAAMYEARLSGTAAGGRYLSPAARGSWAGTLMDRMLLEVAVGTGLRWGEISAVQVRDLSLDSPEPCLHVRRAWKRNPPPSSEFHRPGAGPSYLGPPKTRKSRRRVTLAAVLVDLLRELSAGKAPGDLVFCAPMGAPLRAATWYEDRWQVAVRLAHSRGLTVSPRFHDLRHTHAAWLIAAGVPLPVIQQRLGHESITTTVDIYGGLLPQAHAAADAAINAALSGRVISAPLSLVPPVLHEHPAGGQDAAGRPA